MGKIYLTTSRLLCPGESPDRPSESPDRNVRSRSCSRHPGFGRSIRRSPMRRWPRRSGPAGMFRSCRRRLSRPIASPPATPSCRRARCRPRPCRPGRHRRHRRLLRHRHLHCFRGERQTVAASEPEISASSGADIARRRHNACHRGSRRFPIRQPRRSQRRPPSPPLRRTIKARPDCPRRRSSDSVSPPASLSRR